ncbi:MAG: hypothetical protein HC816_03215 [Leptolyngbyaceae cyanobacterium RM1_1_2]|nr:hypothetical protein [Leptolyngbyaceae cyanobacterium RM1_1_2]
MSICGTRNYSGSLEGQSAIAVVERSRRLSTTHLQVKIYRRADARLKKRLTL